MDWFEILVPIIFVVIWILSSIFSNRGGDESEGPDSSRGRDEEIPDDIRRIQEEIRRKIRQRQEGDEATEPQAAAPDRSRRQQPRPAGPPPTPAFSRSDDSVSRGVRSYEAELAAKMKEVEASRRRVDALRKGDSSASSAFDQRRTRRRNISRGIRSSVIREILDDPHGRRKAVLYLEILGQPVGMRRNGAIRPSWDL